VSVGGKIAYESTSQEAAAAVAARFDNAVILKPGETA
jgi:cobyric acid synthase